MSSLNEAVALIGSVQRMAVFTHTSPDPDAIGSLLGMGQVLTALGKDVALICEDPIPRGLEFLPAVDEVSKVVPDQFAPQLLVSLDASDPARLGGAFQALATGAIPVLNVDHHVTNLSYGTVNVVCDCASAAEVILHVADALQVQLDQDLATCLLTGIIGDTRSFSTSSVSEATLQAAGRCVASGADIASVTEAVFFRKTLGQLRLWGIALAHLNFRDGILWSIIPLAERQRAGLASTSLDGFSSLLLSAEGAKMAVVFSEQQEDKVELSMRARPGFDVAQIALSFGGGGHTLAAGCTVQGELDSIVEDVINTLSSQTIRRPDEPG